LEKQTGIKKIKIKKLRKLIKLRGETKKRGSEQALVSFGKE
jgi:hypothetical protein